LKITGIITNAFRQQKILNKTRKITDNTQAVPAFLYGSEIWTIKARDARRITATAGYTWITYKTNKKLQWN
jgi:hypothetical protein